MPTYDYRCEANGQIYEVNHKMSESVLNWGQLVERLGIAAGDIPSDAKVTRLATGGQVVNSASLGDAAQGCGMAGVCGNGSCGMR